MNPEISPWMLIADKQRQSDLRRQQEERDYKHYLQKQYQKELEDQINLHKELKMKEKQREKDWERNLINSSIENQQRIIEMEKMKAQAFNQKQSRLDFENQYFKAARKQRSEFLEEQSKTIQNDMHRQAEQKQRRQQQQAERKKKLILQNLKESMNTKQIRQKMTKLEEDEFQNHKIQQNQVRAQRQDQYRQDYLRKLKQKAMTIDYGSHEAFNKNHQKTLLQKKKEEWENEKEFIRRAQQLDTYENEYKRMKVGMQKQFGLELQKQIIDREQNKRNSSKRELQHDQQAIHRYQSYSKSLDISKKEAEDRNKKDLLEYLQRQADDRKRVAKEQPYFMRDRQLELNYDLLQHSKGIVPGDTYDLDYSRKKQLQTVAKSIAYSPSRVDKNFLAERGKTILS